MRPLIYGFIIVVVILASGLIPFANGYFLKKNYFALINAINQENKLNIKVLEYKRGYISSTAKISIEPVEHSNEAFPIHIIVDQNISHGPMVYDALHDRWKIALAAIYSRIRLSPFLQILLSQNSTENPVSIQTFVNIKGGFLNQIVIPALTIQIPNLGKLNWQGLHGNVFLDVNREGLLAQIKSVMNIGQITIENSKDRILIQSITANQDTMRQAKGLWNGSYTISLPEIMINDSNSYIRLTQLNLQSKFGVENEDFYHTAVDISLANLVTQEFSLQSTFLKLSGTNFNANELAKIKQTDIEAQEFEKLILRILTPKTIFHGNLGLNSSYGRIAADGIAAWPLNTPLPDKINDLTDKFNLKINLRISISLVAQLMNLAAKKQTLEYTTQIAQTPSAPSESDNESLEKYVTQLDNSDEITVDVAVRLRDLQKQHLSLEDYSANIDEYVLRKEINAQIADQLKTKYAVYLNQPNQEEETKPKTATTLTPTEFNLKERQKMQQQLTDLINKGYIIVDKSDYVVNLVREQGITKINGKVVNEKEFMNNAQVIPALPH